MQIKTIKIWSVKIYRSVALHNLIVYFEQRIIVFDIFQKVIRPVNFQNIFCVEPVKKGHGFGFLKRGT
jgi:hypothetical protein